MTTQYSTVQKLSLAGMVIGFLLCLVGGAAPYWIVSDPKAEGFDLDGIANLVGKVVKGNLGLFMYCVKVLTESKCEVIDVDNDNGWFHSARVGASACIVLAAVCGGTSMCLACCNCCKRFIVLGILAFLAAVAGAFCVIVFSKNTESFTGSILGFQVSSYGWAYYMFIGGVGVLGIVSFMACFSAPDNPLRGMVLSQPAGGQIIVSTSTTTARHPYMHLQEQGGPVMMGPCADPGATVVTTNGY